MRSGAIERRPTSGCVAANRGESLLSAPSKSPRTTRLKHLAPDKYTLGVRAAGYQRATEPVVVLSSPAEEEASAKEDA